MTNVIEEYVDILGFEGKYMVSNTGNVKTIGRWSHAEYSKRWIDEGIKNAIPDKDGYLIVTLSVSPKKKRISIHRLVAKAFIPNPDGKPQVNHIDGNKRNNHVLNLEWCTSSENNFHAYRICRKTIHRPYTKLNIEKVSDIKMRISNGETVKDISLMYGVNQATISNIKTGKTWNI